MATRRNGNPPGASAARKNSRASGAVDASGNGAVQGVDLHFVFPSDYGALRDVQKQINSALDAQHYDEDSVFAIKLAMEECLVNAVKHGNKGDPAKSVKVDVKLDRKQFDITIQDQGAGFKRKEIPDPTAMENLDKPSGRGLLLIESYMDSVKYSDKGRRVRMVRRNRATG
jgi:serine/threonine-protein kinase RsbW